MLVHSKQLAELLQLPAVIQSIHLILQETLLLLLLKQLVELLHFIHQVELITLLIHLLHLEHLRLPHQ
jgi:hypothetical protein